FLYFVYRRFGRWPFRMVLAPVVAYFFVFAGTQRRASKEYLRRVGVPGPLPLAVLRHFWSFAEATLDKLIAWKGGIRAEDVSYEGRDPVQAVLGQGRGLLLIGSHLGNLEVCRVMALLRPGLVVHILVHTRNAENFNRLLKRLDPTGGVNLVQVSDFGAGQAAWLSERIGLGEVVLIAGDRRPVGAGRTLSAEFLGAEAPFSQGPFALASALGCPVFLIFCLKQGRRFRIIYEPFAELIHLPRAGREEALRDAVRRYALRLQDHCLRAPYQWFNFYPFWS
ncbi:MAG TPA: hypothetical protein VK786_07815, partial [bacterium]|nr:hypothetical protein [bacterium]